MTRSTAFTVTQADNGYFETLTRTACGHTVRVQTESFGYRLQVLKDQALALRKHLRDKAIARPCHKCARPVCVASFPDLLARATSSAQVYADTPDGGYPGTPAAITYRAEQHAVYAEAAARTARLVRFAVTGVMA